MERRMKSKQGLHTRSKSFTEASAEPAVVQRQSTYDDSHTRHMNGGGTQDVWMNSFSSWKMKRIQATSQERDRKAVRDEVEETQQKLRRKKSKTFREIVEEKQSREKMLGSYVDNNGEFTEIIADLPSTNLDSDNEHENHRTPSPPRRNSTDYTRNDTDHDTYKEHKPQKSSAQPPQNYKEERDDRRKELRQRSNTLPSNYPKPDGLEKRAPPPVKPKPRSRSVRSRSKSMNTRIPEPEVITMTQSSQVHAAPPPARRVSPPPTVSRVIPPATRSFTRAPVTRNDKGSDSTDQPLTFREKVLRAQGSEQEAQQATEAARKPYKAKRSNIFDKIRAFDTGDAFKKVVDDAVAANQKQETRVPVEEDDHEDLVIIMTQKARSYRGFGFTTSGGYDEKKPLVVAEVSSDSVADYSDLRVGDQLLSINKESTRRFNQDDVQQCLSQSILTGKLTCKVRRYPDGKVPENAASLPVNQRIHPPSQENNNPPLTRSRTLPTRDPPGKDPSLPTERTRPPVSTQRTEPTPLAGQVRPHPRATKVPSLPPTQKTQPTLLAGQAQDTRVPSVPSEQTTNQARGGMEPAHDDDGEDEDAEVDALRPGRTKNALARARQMLDELEMDDESSSKSSELTDQSPVQSSNIPLYSHPIKTDDASQVAPNTSMELIIGTPAWTHGPQGPNIMDMKHLPRSGDREVSHPDERLGLLGSSSKEDAPNSGRSENSIQSQKSSFPSFHYKEFVSDQMLGHLANLSGEEDLFRNNNEKSYTSGELPRSISSSATDVEECPFDTTNLSRNSSEMGHSSYGSQDEVDSLQVAVVSPAVVGLNEYGTEMESDTPNACATSSVVDSNSAEVDPSEDMLLQIHLTYADPEPTGETFDDRDMYSGSESTKRPLNDMEAAARTCNESDDHNSADEERSVSSVEEEKVAEPLFQPSAPIRPLHQEPSFEQPAPFKSLPQEPKPPGMRHLIIRHAPSSSLDGGSTRTQVSSSYPRGFRSIAAPRPRGQSDPPPPARTTTTRDLASEDQPKPESDTHRRRNDFFQQLSTHDGQEGKAEEDEVDMLGRPLVEPVIAPDLDKSSSQSMPATHSINPATAHRKPFNREEERRRLERWNEEQEKRRQERYALEQQRLKEEEERALSTAAVDIQRKREQEERELEAKRLEMQRQQEELQQIRQRQMEEEEKRKRAKLEQERLERERRELEVAEGRRQEEEKRIARERQIEEEKRKRAKLEQERREREAAEQERREMEEAERRRQEEERIERENALEEKRRKLEQERQEQEDLERKQREEEERIERKRIEEQERIKRERAQREQAAREVIRKEQEDYAAKLKERERERQEQEQARLEEAEEKKRLEEEEQQRLEIEKWRLESQERERASLQLTQAKQEGEQRLIEEERERIRAEEREKIRQEWEEERQRELEQLQMQKEQLRRERQELDRLQEQERKRLQEEKDRLKKRDELERHSPPIIEVPLSKMTNGEVMSALKQSLSSGSSPRSLGHSTGSVGHSSGSVGGHSPRSTTGYSSGSVGQSPRTMSPAAAQRTRDNNQRNMLPEKDRPHPPNHSIMSHYKDPNIPASQHWLVQEAERRRVAEQRGFDRQTSPDVIIPPHSKASPPRPAHSGYPKGFDPEVPTRIPAQRSRPPVQSQEAPANMTGVRRRMRGPEGDAERQRKMVNRRSLPDLSGGVDNATHRPAQQSTAPPSANAGRSSKQGGPPPHSIPGRGSAFQEPNKALPPPPNQAVSGKMQCCGCNKSLGRGAAMIIESLGLHFHVDCFRCCVCSIRLGNGSKGTDVRIRASQLHCQNCYSNEAGFQFTEV